MKTDVDFQNTGKKSAGAGRQATTGFERRLLSLLKQNARRSVTELAAVLNVSRTTVKDKMDLLEQSGVIKSYTIDVMGFEKELNTCQALLNVSTRTDRCEKLYTFISGWPEVKACWSISSNELDMVILIEARSNERIYELRNSISRHPDVKTLSTSVILHQWAHKL